jgi:tRNA A-37 threonylcarbamoyl transferase component Bud32
MNPDSSSSTCPQCHAPLPADAPQGLCPCCLMAVAGLATDQDTLPLTAADLPELADIAAAFPDLELVEKIGQGGMGVVFKARQPKLDRLVALKVLPKALAATPGFAERFTREGRVLARLSHPSIVTVHDFGESGGYCFLIMEYVDGVNLRQAMRAGRFTPEQALKVVPDICAALQAAHEQGVLHRDIKPENLLLDTKGRIKIADFGIAKLIDDRGADLLLTQSGAKLGTAPYMAPEQIEQPSSVDHRADIYSLGVVLYEMLTGELPLGRFAAPSEKAAVGGNIDEIVFRALEKERGRRQQSAGEFKTQIEGAGLMPRPRRPLRFGDPFEYQSKRRLCGMPLLHITGGIDPDTGKRREAYGFVAVGGRARGVFAFGVVARGWFAFGGVALGLVACGGVGIGVVSFGVLALGLLLAYGVLGIGTLAVGGLAAGYHAVGGLVLGWHGIGAMVLALQGYGAIVHATVVMKEMAAMPLLTHALYSTKNWSYFLFLTSLPVSTFIGCAQSWGREQAAAVAGSSSEGRVSKRIFWAVPAMAVVAVVWAVLMRMLVDAVEPSTPWVVVPSGVTIIGLLFFILALPLWLKMVPMNQFYGLRIPSTMVSDERWYAANAHAGRTFLIWALVILGAGLAGFFQLPRHQDDYPWAVLALTLTAVAVILVSVWSWLRHHPAMGSETKPSRLAKYAGQFFTAIVVAYFIKGFIFDSYRMAGRVEAGVNQGSHWIACKLDTGFDPGDLIAFAHESGHAWIARVVKREKDGLVLKRGGQTDTFFVKWNQVIGKLVFSHFTPDVVPQP